MVDRGGRLVAWNPAAERLLGGLELQPDMRLLHELARVLKNGDDRTRLRSSRELADILTGEAEPGTSHVFRYAGTGEERWLEFAVIPVPARRGGLTAVCLTMSDVSEQRRAEHEREELALHMRDLDKLQSLERMAGGVAHDFNNLLTAIVGNTQLALDELPSGAELHDYLSEVRESARAAAELTDQLLAYAGRSEPLAEPISLSELVQDMEPLLKSSMPSNVEFRAQLAKEVPVVSGDPGQLRQVVLNLVVNAAQA
ncbi:MAG: two-component system sensor histidine kinase NtrB, partial [Myxococcota bacterium]